VEPHKLSGDQTPVGGGNRLSTVDPALDHDAIAAEMAIDSSKRNRDKKSDFVEVFDQLKLPLQRRCGTSRLTHGQTAPSNSTRQSYDGHRARVA
jgi:hypothetical protein